MQNKKEKIALSKTKKIENVLYCYIKYVNKIKYFQDILKTGNIEVKRVLCLTDVPKGLNFEFKSEFEKKEDLKRLMLEDISRMQEIIYRIDSAITMLEDEKCIQFIYTKYFKKNTMEATAEIMDMSTQNLYKIKAKALRLLEIHFITQKLI